LSLHGINFEISSINYNRYGVSWIPKMSKIISNMDSF
jgi:hypothetical protein